MINELLFEAKLIGFKEGLKIGLIWLVFYSYLLSIDKKSLIPSFYTGVISSLLLGLLFLLLPGNLVSSHFVGNIISMSFALFLILSCATLYNASGVNLFFGKNEIKSHSVAKALVFFSTLIFFLPDITGSIFYLDELATLKENVLWTYVSAVAGLIIAGIIITAVTKLYKPFWLGSFFALPQLLLFFAMVKLFGSGIKGVAELSLIPSVQRGFMKFIHDFVHQTFVMLMVPDHPLLKKTTWDFIAVFFGPNFALIASLFILLTLPTIFIYHSLFKPLPEAHGETNVSKRRIKSLILSDRRKKALPIMLFVVFIIAAWFTHEGETVSKTYTPEPIPVVVNEEMLVMPLKTPSMNLMDGNMHKFSLLHQGKEIRIIVTKKSDNSLSVCLDACEICPPVGYGQRDDHVVCIYCDTPIPINTLGIPGGCNPIPLSATIDEDFIRIEMKEVLKKWGFVNLKNTK